MLFLLYRSSERTVQDRIKNYFQKYLPAAQEVTERDVVAVGGQPGTPKFQKLRDELIATRLDTRPKKPAGQTVVLPPSCAFLKRCPVGFGKRNIARVGVEIHGSTQQTVPAQNIEQLSRHEGSKIGYTLIFNPDMLRMSSGEN